MTGARIAVASECPSGGATFHKLLEAAPDGILFVESGGVIGLANARCSSMFGFEQSELIGSAVEMLVPLSLQAKHVGLREAYFENARTRPMGINLELLALCKDGSELPVEISLSPFRLEGRDGVVAIVRDVTTLRRLARELKASNQKLTRTNLELQRSNEELEKFAYVASHDLQEPLRAVSNYVQLLKRRYANKLDREAGEYVEFAVEGVKRMQILIQDLLGYTRIGTRGNRFTDIDCNEVLDEVLANLKVMSDASNAKVTHDALPTIYGDRTQLVQLFQNLIGNSLKFRRDMEDPIVHVGAEDLGDHWQFTVADNGIGIEPEYAEKVYVIFQRLNERDKFSGTGIGLAICKKIVERHNGAIWFESKPGEGTTFHVKLPAKEPSA